jgi:hypothetical protein
MHWSYNVRMVFMNLLQYRIRHIHKSEEMTNLNEEQLINQYR